MNTKCIMRLNEDKLEEGNSKKYLKDLYLAASDYKAFIMIVLSDY